MFPRVPLMSEHSTDLLNETMEIDMLPPTPLKMAPCAQEAPESPRATSKLPENVKQPGQLHNKKYSISKSKSYASLKVQTKQCPHCLRVFNVLVADDHIPKCKNIRAKPKPPPNEKDL